MGQGRGLDLQVFVKILYHRHSLSFLHCKKLMD